MLVRFGKRVSVSCYFSRRRHHGSSLIASKFSEIATFIDDFTLKMGMEKHFCEDFRVKTGMKIFKTSVF